MCDVTPLRNEAQDLCARVVNGVGVGKVGVSDGIYTYV